MSATEQQALVSLRRMILDGSISPGDKISEVIASDMLGVSRTPARGALATLAHEGLIEKREGRGYTVKEIDIEDLRKAVAVRGVLEGLAAATMARDGISDTARAAFEKSLKMSTSVVTGAPVTSADIETYQAANTLFHLTIIHECGNEFVAQAYDRIKHLPMLGPGMISVNKDRIAHEATRMFVGHTQHVIIHDAILSGDATRAENMMREHSNTTLRYPELFGNTDAGDSIAHASLEWGA